MARSCRRIRLLSLVFGILSGLSLAPAQASAVVFTMNPCFYGDFGCIDFNRLGLNLTNALFSASALVCTAIFIVGAAFVVFSAGNDTPLQKGRGMMTGSAIGLAIVVGSYAIYRTVVFLLYS